MKSIFLFSFVLLCQFSLHAQLPPACAGGSPATTCATACINCNFNGYSGSTAGYPSGVVPNFCGTVENAQWMGFIAGAGFATFTVTPSNCADGNGLQIALYEDCMGMPLACEKGDFDNGNVPVSVSASISPGRNYFLMIDGFAGDQCDFTVSVSPNDAVYEPPLGAVGQLSGPDRMCPGATMPFSVPPVFGAGAYIWSGPPGAMIDTMPLPATIVGPGANQVNITMGNTGGQICVQAANSCQSTAPCSASLNVTLLDDSYRPVVEADTLQHLGCTSPLIELEVQAPASSGFSFVWTADSSGHIVSGAQLLRPKVDSVGVYNLLITNSQNGCTTSIDIAVGPPDTPRITDLRLRNITCYGAADGEVNAAAIQGGRAPWLFSFDGAPYAYAQTFRYLEPGEHHLAIESSDGCRSDTSFVLSEPAEMLMDLGEDTTIHLGTDVRLWAENQLNYPDRIAKVEVKPAALNGYLCDTCSFYPKHSFHYTITVSDSNGCTAIDDRTIAVGKERYIYAPTVFQPGENDGPNGQFSIFCGEDVERVLTFRIVNRWGKVVHQREDFLPNDAVAAWDGRLDGEPATPAVFVWEAQIRFKDGETEWMNGDVSLIR